MLSRVVRFHLWWLRGAIQKRGLFSRAVSACLGVPVTFVYCVETAKDTAIVAMECELETVSLKLSNGTIFNALERPGVT